MAVTKHAIAPDSDVPALILGDKMEEPIQEATGSAKAKHSTAYRGIIHPSTILTVMAVPNKK
jgi:hypothetical protein